MAIVDGQQVDAANSNAAWASKSTDNTLVGVQTLNAAGSGSQVTNAQQTINDNLANVATNTTNIGTNATKVGNLEGLSGELSGSTTHSNFSGTTIPDSSSSAQALQALETAVELRIPSSEKGASNGVAELDGTGKVPTAQLPAAVLGALQYQGVWNATTNTPSISDAGGAQGEYYVVSTAGSQDLGSGSISFGVGDWAVHNGSVFDHLDASDVQSVNGQTGVVSLDSDDIAEGSTNEYYTNVKADARIAAASIDDLSDADTSTVAPTVNDSLVWDGSNWTPAVPPTTFSYAVAEKTTAYTATTGDTVILCDTSSAGFTVTLYTPVGNAGKTLEIKKNSTDANLVTVSGSIDNLSAIVLQGSLEYVRLISDGTVWVVTGSDLRTTLEVSRTSDYTFTSGGPNVWRIPDSAYNLVLQPGVWDIDIFGQAISTATSAWTGELRLALGSSTTPGSSLVSNSQIFFGIANLAGVGGAGSAKLQQISVTAATTLYLNIRAANRSSTPTFVPVGFGWQASAGQPLTMSATKVGF